MCDTVKPATHGTYRWKVPINRVRHGSAYLVTIVALAGRSATFWSTAMKKPPVSMWCGSTRMQRSRCRSLGFSGNIDLHRRPCVSLCISLRQP